MKTPLSINNCLYISIFYENAVLQHHELGHRYETLLFSETNPNGNSNGRWTVFRFPQWLVFISLQACKSSSITSMPCVGGNPVLHVVYTYFPTYIPIPQFGVAYSKMSNFGIKVAIKDNCEYVSKMSIFSLWTQPHLYVAIQREYYRQILIFFHNAMCVSRQRHNCINIIYIFLF